MELIEDRAGDLPAMLLVHVAEGHCIGQKFIADSRGACLASPFTESDGKLDDGSIRLSFLLMLVCQGPHAIEHIAVFRSMVLHTCDSSPESRVV